MTEKKGFINEFKEFISRGSVMDLAVGVVMGSAFTAIVTSMVNDIIMPLIGVIFGGLNFAELKYVVTPATEDAAEAAIYYGNFIQSVVNFLLIALVIFSLIKVLNRFHGTAKKDEEAPAEAEEVVLLREIRDCLQQDK